MTVLLRSASLVRTHQGRQPCHAHGTQCRLRETFTRRGLANDAHAIALITSRSVYDSMYLALALRLDTRVITADERFFHALQSFPDLAGSIELLA